MYMMKDLRDVWSLLSTWLPGR